MAKIIDIERPTFVPHTTTDIERPILWQKPTPDNERLNFHQTT